MVTQRKKYNISVVVPIFNEEETLPILYEETKKVLGDCGGQSELVFVDDGSTDKSAELLHDLAQSDRRVRVFRFDSNKGQCEAIGKGCREATSEFVVTMDGDLQTIPDDIPLLVDKLIDGFDVVCGWRWQRKDKWDVILKSKIANFVQRKVTGLQVHDMCCGLRAYKKEVIKHFFYRERYRHCLVPLILFRNGRKVTEVKVRHFHRRFGKSKHSFLSSSFGVIKCYVKLLLGKL